MEAWAVAKRGVSAVKRRQWVAAGERQQQQRRDRRQLCHRPYVLRCLTSPHELGSVPHSGHAVPIRLPAWREGPAGASCVAR